jgi:hypothetical protein
MSRHLAHELFARAREIAELSNAHAHEGDQKACLALWARPVTSPTRQTYPPDESGETVV